MPQSSNRGRTADTSQDLCALEEQGSNQGSLFYFHGNESCLTCVGPCSRCAMEVRDLEHPCTSCVEDFVFVPGPEFLPGAITHVEGDAFTGNFLVLLYRGIHSSHKFSSHPDIQLSPLRKVISLP